jgi:hypothetical protein
LGERLGIFSASPEACTFADAARELTITFEKMFFRPGVVLKDHHQLSGHAPQSDRPLFSLNYVAVFS